MGDEIDNQQEFHQECNEETHELDENLLTEIKKDLKEYNDIVDDSLKKIDSGIKQIEEVLNNATTNYQDMIKSDRHKYSMVTAETSKSISSLVKEGISLTTTKVNISKARLENNIKSRTIVKELEKVVKQNNSKNTNKSDNFNPLQFLNNVSTMFASK